MKKKKAKKGNQKGKKSKSEAKKKAQDPVNKSLKRPEKMSSLLKGITYPFARR